MTALRVTRKPETWIYRCGEWKVFVFVMDDDIRVDLLQGGNPSCEGFGEFFCRELAMLLLKVAEDREKGRL